MYFYSKLKIFRYLRRVKKYNPVAKVMCLDIGRMEVGVAISDTSLQHARPFGSYYLEFGKVLPTFPDKHDIPLDNNFFRTMKNKITNNKVKALIVNYPTRDSQKIEKYHSYVEQFIKYGYEYFEWNSPLYFYNSNFKETENLKITENYLKGLPDQEFLIQTEKDINQDICVSSFILNAFLKEYNTNNQI